MKALLKMMMWWYIGLIALYIVAFPASLLDPTLGYSIGYFCGYVGMLSLMASLPIIVVKAIYDALHKTPPAEKE